MNCTRMIWRKERFHPIIKIVLMQNTVDSAARNWLNSVSLAAATTFVFSSVFILLYMDYTLVGRQRLGVGILEGLGILVGRERWLLRGASGPPGGPVVFTGLLNLVNFLSHYTIYIQYIWLMSKDKITAASTLDAVAFNKISHIDSSVVTCIF